MSLKKSLLIMLASVAVIVLGGFCAYTFYNQPQPAALSQTNQTQNQVQEPGPGLPTRLTIPSINVDAPIIDVGLAPDGSVGVPKGPVEVAWFQLGPRPGQTGSAIITGHFGPWKSGAHSVFDNLYKLKIGDTIYVKDDKGNTLSFTVKNTKTYNPSESPKEVFNQTNGTYLNLITCNGDWLADQKTYNKRLVIFTQLATS